ncbi:MAG: hypothetical protein RLN85_11715, partial [Pseudomonadales bacterium]
AVVATRHGPFIAADDERPSVRSTTMDMKHSISCVLQCFGVICGMLQRNILAVLVGAVVLTIVGYFVYAAPGDAASFKYWLSRPARSGAVWWALLGGFLGVSLNWLVKR